MYHKEYNWKSKDGLNIYAQGWFPVNKPNAILYLVHGLGEHSNRYEFWSGLFVENDIAVIALDYRGHGKSGGRRGHASSFNILLNDIDLMFSQTNSMFPDTPRILYGHSLGGTLAIDYAIRKNPPIRGLIASSPWLKLFVEPEIYKIQIGKALNKVVPFLTIKTGIKSEELNNGYPVINDFDKDPLLHDRISLKLYFETQLHGPHALKNIYKINVPFIMMYGENDHITSYKVCKEYVNNTSKKTKLKIWEGFNHNLHNEPEHFKVHRFLVDWINMECLKKQTKVNINEFVQN